MAIYIGTSGWIYPWKGIFYPEDLKSREYLKFYSSQLATVEVNSSFYHMTRATTVLKWYEETPESFRFALKMHRSITHLKRLKDVELEVETQMNSFLLLKKKLGIILIQLPASLKYNKEYEQFFSFLREQYPTVNFALEARSVSWFDEVVLQMLKKYHITWVIADAGVRIAGKEAVTSDSVYIRFHGDEKLYSSSYTDEKLQVYASKIQRWHEVGKNVWVFFNNTMQGAAVENIRTLSEMLYPKGRDSR